MSSHCFSMLEVEDLMLDAVRQILKIPDDNSIVRSTFGANSETGSAPIHNLNDSVCYVTVTTTDDGYGKQHYIRYEKGADGELLTEIDEYTEEYAIIFSCYGDDSYEKARRIRDGLYGNKAMRLFQKQKIHLVVGTPQLVYTRELISTNWIRRCDFTAIFYAFIRVERPNEVDWYEKVNINFKTSQPS